MIDYTGKHVQKILNMDLQDLAMLLLQSMLQVQQLQRRDLLLVSLARTAVVTLVYHVGLNLNELKKLSL